MKKTFLFLIIITLTLTLSACTNGEQNNLDEDANFLNEQEEEVEIDIETGNYIVDTEVSSLEWLGEGIVGNSRNGDIEIKSGSLNMEDSKISSGEFVIDMTTISDSDNNEKLETHLKGDDFFLVSEYPEAKLVINNSKIISSNSSEEIVLEVEADLKIKEITNPIEFTITLREENNELLANSEFSIDRTRWDIKYNSGSFFQDLGDKVIKDEIYFNTSIVANK